MKKSYLNLEINSAISLRLSMTIRLLLMVLFVGLFGNVVNAQVTITKPNLSIPVCSSFPSSYSVLGDIVINENNNGDFASSATSKTIILSAPANFEFKPLTGAIAYRGGRDITASSIVVTASTITITYTCTTTGNDDRLTLSGLEVRAINAVSSGNVIRTGGTGTISGLVTNTTLTNTLTSTLSAMPTATAGGTQTICQSSTATVSGATSSNGTIAWTENGAGSITSGATTLTPVYTPAAGDAGNTVVLTMNVSNSCGVATATYSVIVNDLPSNPTLINASSTSVCDGSSLTLNATSPGNTIYWFDQQNGGISIGSSLSGENFTFIPTKQSTRYYAEAISPDGCSSSTRTRTVTIALTNPPTITSQPTAPASVCSGNPVILSVSATASGAVSYQWRKDGVNISGANSSTYTISNPTTSISGSVFDVVVSRSGCSVVSEPVSFTVNPSPSAAITGASGICAGSSTALTAATPGGTWSSSNAARATVDTNGVVTGVSTGNFTITYSVSSNGCTVTSTKAMSVSSAPTPVVSFSQGNLDSNLNITACQEVGGGGQNDLDILSGNPNGSTYQWQVSYDNGVNWVNAAGPTNTQNQYVLDPFYTVFTSNPGTYKFRLLIDNNGCSGVSNLLTLTVTGTSALTAGTIVGNQSSCGQSLDPAGFTSSAAAGGMSPPNYTYQWQSSIDGVNFTNIAGATAATYNSPAIAQTTYFRRSVRSGGCSAFSNVLSVLVGAPVANVSQPNCTSSAGTVTVPFPVSGITYTITGPNPETTTVTNTTGVFSGLTPGDYDIRFIAAAACVSLPTSVTVNEQPLVPSMPVTTTAQPCGVPTGTITVTPQNAGETYSFDNGATFQSSNIKSGLAPGNYYVIIKNLVCNSPAKLTVINTSPRTPTTPVITSVIHPNCAVSTGTITVTVQNAGDFYSFDNGLTFQSSNIKSGLTAGSYNVIIQSAGGCNSTSKQVTINTQPNVPLAPTLTETVPTCATQTGTITITQVVGETYSFDGGAFSNTLIYSGLAQGSLHTVRAQNAGGCISSDTNISITSLSNTWSAGSWAFGTPTAEQNIVFDDTFSSTEDLSGCSCQVNSGINVTINSPNTLTLTNAVTVSGTGNLIFEDTASLVQINNTNLNSGNITYKRINTSTRETDYTYWSSPVANQQLIKVSPKTSPSMFYSFDSSEENWVAESTSNNMSVGKGYIIGGVSPNPPNPPAFWEAPFNGVPNNGHYEILSIIPDKSYLIGNPYPSALDADEFLLQNKDVLYGTLYFWTHNTKIGKGTSNNGPEALPYTANDYASYNATGGVGVALAPENLLGTASAPSGGAIPTGKIAAGQGFFASSKPSISGTKIVFNNDMRVGVNGITGNNSQFFKTKNPKGKTAQIEKNRVWLNLTNTGGAFKQTLVGYITGATNAIDDDFDGESFDGQEFVDFYSINEDKNLTIQGRALPFEENDEVPLGFRSTIEGSFSINIGQVDGLMTNQDVFIEDKLTNTITNLKSGNYTFNTAAGKFDNRFVLRYTDKTLSVEEKTGERDGIDVLYSNNYKTLIIKNNLKDATLNVVTLYNISGQKIANWDVKEREQALIQIPIKNLPSEIYIVNIKTTEGEFSKKIMIK